MMTDKEFNKLLNDDSQSDAEVGRQRRKRKARDMVCLFSDAVIGLKILN